jgi:hypothetical protein
MKFDYRDPAVFKYPNEVLCPHCVNQAFAKFWIKLGDWPKKMIVGKEEWEALKGWAWSISYSREFLEKVRRGEASMEETLTERKFHEYLAKKKFIWTPSFMNWLDIEVKDERSIFELE